MVSVLAGINNTTSFPFLCSSIDLSTNCLILLYGGLTKFFSFHSISKPLKVELYGQGS